MIRMPTHCLVTTLALAQGLHAGEHSPPDWAVGVWSNTFSLGGFKGTSTWTLDKDSSATEPGAAEGNGKAIISSASPNRGVAAAVVRPAHSVGSSSSSAPSSPAEIPFIRRIHPM
jgi:hypothetical protein